MIEELLQDIGKAGRMWKKLSERESGGRESGGDFSRSLLSLSPAQLSW
jgi:hypothetical protein